MSRNIDDHFSQMLQIKPTTTGLKAQQVSPILSFIPAPTFREAKPGYYFSTGAQGTGYYPDRYESHNNTIEDARVRKRVREHDTTGSEQKRLYAAPDQIDTLIEQAELADITPMDATSLKQLLVTLERRIVRNQQQRAKFYDEPMKFMESEVELHTALTDLAAVAVSPELYPILVEAGAARAILGMVTHENTDISLAAVALLDELFDASTYPDVPESRAFIKAFLDEQGLELIVQNLSRLDERSEEDAQGVYNTLSLIENLIDLVPETVATDLCTRTNILKFLVLRLRPKQFDENKLYASELLSILLNEDPRNSLSLSLIDLDGLDELLKAVAMYRKKDPESSGERECVANIFLSLCSLLLVPEQRDALRSREGLELLIRLLREQKYSAVFAVRTINYALSDSPRNCEAFIALGGLKYVFAILMGKGLPKPEKLHKGTGSRGHASVTAADVRTAEQFNLATLAQLCIYAQAAEDSECSARLLAKFIEHDYEKVDRCLHMIDQELQRVVKTERDLENKIASFARNGDLETLATFSTEENLRAQRLEGGLSNLHQLSVLILFVTVHDDGALERVSYTLRSLGLLLDHVRDVIEDYLEHAEDTLPLFDTEEYMDTIDLDEGEEVSKRGSERTKGGGRANEMKRRVAEWFALWPPSEEVNSRSSSNS